MQCTATKVLCMEKISIPESACVAGRSKAKTTSMLPKTYFGYLNLFIDSIF